jgi:hypothetical protein
MFDQRWEGLHSGRIFLSEQVQRGGGRNGQKPENEAFKEDWHKLRECTSGPRFRLRNRR